MEASNVENDLQTRLRQDNARIWTSEEFLSGTIELRHRPLNDERGMESRAPVRRPKPRRVAESERRRAVKACDACRRQKEKCEGGVPCYRCVRFSRQCEFHGVSPREGSSTLSESNVAELIERSKYMEMLLRHHDPEISFDTETLKRLAEALPTKGDGAPLEMEERSPSSRQHHDQVNDTEDLNFDENFTVKPLAHNTTHYSGEFSYWNFSMRIKQWIEDWVPNSNGEDPQTVQGIKEFYRAEHLESSSFELVNSLSYLPPRHVAEFLISIFFKYAETNYFYVGRGWIQAALESAYETPSPLSTKDSGTVCSLLIVLAIGTQYAYLDSESSRTLAHARSQAPDKLAFSEDDVGRVFFQQASKLIPDVITVASLESVQACLLIGLYTLPLDTSGLSYIYLNLAVKLGIQNGMHRKYVGDGFNDETVETRNRVWWTAYTIERRVCIFHGRPISVKSSDVDAEQPIDRPEMIASVLPTNITNMIASIKLTAFLEDLAHEVSVLRRCQKNEQSESLNRLTRTKNDLLKWWSYLPEQIFCRDTNLQGPLFRPNMHLKLEYCLIRMYVGRPFMFSQNSTTSPSSGLNESGRPNVRISTRSTLIEDCMRAAMEIIDICRCLRDGTGLARASYTEFSSCRAALLVIIAQSLLQKAPELRQALQDGMGMIRMMSAGGDSARSEVSLIEAFDRAISRIDALGDNTNRGLADPAGTGYDLFKSWEQLWKGDSLTSILQQNQQTTSQSQEPSDGPIDSFIGNPAASFFGLDNFPYSYPQVMEEFSAIPTFDYEAESGIQNNQWTDMDQL